MKDLRDLRDGIAEVVAGAIYRSGGEPNDCDVGYFTNKILNLKVEVECPKMNHFDTTDKHDVEWFKGCPDCKGTLYIGKTLKEWWG